MANATLNNQEVLFNAAMIRRWNIMEMYVRLLLPVSNYLQLNILNHYLYNIYQHIHHIPTHISVFIQATGEYPEEEEWWRRDCYKSPDGFLGCKNDDRTNGTMRMDVETCFCQESLCNEKIQDFTTSSTPSTTTPKGNYKIVQRVITPYQC